ncbi:hypothetical protein E2C01_101407 [Portunus trituberculatus]|uniref:Uncharacterized protein n=1 Tax=Portunus trituberculatus TaxID=210409 RepID=A0A5B7K5M4_PORTR|nr:hypothetical protein [Portunus trituberculatus]
MRRGSSLRLSVTRALTGCGREYNLTVSAARAAGMTRGGPSQGLLIHATLDQFSYCLLEPFVFASVTVMADYSTSTQN